MPATTLARAAVAALAALALAAPAAAPLGAQTTYFGADARTAFLAAATTPVTNGIDTQTSTYAFGALGTGTVSGNGVWTGNGSIFATGGGLPTPAFTISFSSTLGAFGADFTSLGTFPADAPYARGVAEFTFYDGATTVGAFQQNFGTSGDRVFYGLTGLAAFDRVEVRTNVGDEFFTDDVVVGARLSAAPPATTVPEPSTVALLGGGLLGLAGVARRRRPATA